MEALLFFLEDHARVHSLLVAESEGSFSLEDNLFRGLEETDARQCPQGMNSIAWHLWHMARCEDVATNVVIAGRRQVLDEDDWVSRMRIPNRDIGTGWTKQVMTDLSNRADITALRAYRAAVGRSTREIASSITADQLKVTYGEEHRRRVAEEGALLPVSEWVHKFWADKSMGWFLSWLGAGHNYMHLGKAIAVKAIVRPGTTR